ncbi:MAG: aspartate--tRNA ligase [Patescibacteria group bacterium]
MENRVLTAQTTEKIGEEINLYGWVNSRRDHGGVVFVDLRDRSGLVQLVCTPEQVEDLRNEYVLEVKGEVKQRPESMVNPELKTGEVEIKVGDIEILSKSKTPPFSIHDDGYEINEKIRMDYRYLDLRRSRMAKNLRQRCKAVQYIRNYLLKRDFCEVETPILSKSTPEGARDFLVPSRLQPGKFYALPQSPQQYKQLLMVAGVERYFQIARCFRDEDPRADRAYGEFTQLDLEMSFVTQEEILQLTEDLFTTMVESIWPEKKIKEKPWPRLSYDDVMKRYDSDKPDLRESPEDPDELAFAWVVDFPLFVEQTEKDYFHGAGENLAPSHHMFTAPHPEDVGLLDSNPLEVRGLQHDLVLNGFEVGGGSIRIHQADIQEKVFELIGFGEEQKQEFEHLLTAFRYGVPPHGGIAPGIDRLLMVILGELSLREVMAFPTSGSGETSVMDAPSEVSSEQLEELGIEVREKD